MAKQFAVHPNQVTAGKAQLYEGAAAVFGGDRGTTEAVVDLKELCAKVVEPRLQNDFVSDPLSKGGLLSAKR